MLQRALKDFLTLKEQRIHFFKSLIYKFYVSQKKKGKKLAVKLAF